MSIMTSIGRPKSKSVCHADASLLKSASTSPCRCAISCHRASSPAISVSSGRIVPSKPAKQVTGDDIEGGVGCRHSVGRPDQLLGQLVRVRDAGQAVPMTVCGLWTLQLKPSRAAAATAHRRSNLCQSTRLLNCCHQYRLHRRPRLFSASLTHSLTHSICKQITYCQASFLVEALTSHTLALQGLWLLRQRITASYGCVNMHKCAPTTINSTVRPNHLRAQSGCS
jgi:hypothetical protein